MGTVDPGAVRRLIGDWKAGTAASSCSSELAALTSENVSEGDGA